MTFAVPGVYMIAFRPHISLARQRTAELRDRSVPFIVSVLRRRRRPTRVRKKTVLNFARQKQLLVYFVSAAAMAEERVERRLTAILAADIAGYSRLMGADEEGTLAALKTLRREVTDPKIKEHRGRIVHTTGDGLLSEFASVVDAVRCAVEVQREMAARNTGVQPERRIDFRIRHQSQRHHHRRQRHLRRRCQRRGAP